MKLKQQGNEFYITSKKDFQNQPIDKSFVNDAFDFAYAMVFGEGFHRNHRSGGQHKRKKGELFANTLQGKLAEFIVHEQLKQQGLTGLSEVDTSIHGQGVWDDTDLQCNGKKINIKSMAFFSNLLLLEVKDWNEKGEYIPNLNSSLNSNSDSQVSTHYDYFVVVRIKPDIKQRLQKARLFYANDISRQDLENIVFEQLWFFDVAGVCSHKSIQHIIARNYLLPKNALLNGKTKMDADNYYIQTGDLKSFDFFVEKLTS